MKYSELARDFEAGKVKIRWREWGVEDHLVMENNQINRYSSKELIDSNHSIPSSWFVGDKWEVFNETTQNKNRLVKISRLIEEIKDSLEKVTNNLEDLEILYAKLSGRKFYAQDEDRPVTVIIYED